MEIACLDLEGVLVPEIWIEFAKVTGIESLKATTRDIPDYDVLMKQRLKILADHNLGLKDIQEVIAGMSPMPGAREFIDWLREREYTSVAQMKGSMSQQNSPNPSAFARASYLHAINSFTPPAGVRY